MYADLVYALKKQYLRLQKMYVLAGVTAITIIFLALVSWYILRDTDNAETATLTSLADIRVPEMGERNAPSDVAIPSTSLPAAPYSPAEFRSFDLSLNKDRLSKEKIIANKGDTLNINLSSLDQSYSLSIPQLGLSQTVEKWFTKIIQFQASQSWIFDLICDSCPKSPKIWMIVIK